MTAAFTSDPRQEALLALKAGDPGALAALPLEVRMANGYDESAKAAVGRPGGKGGAMARGAQERAARAAAAMGERRRAARRRLGGSFVPDPTLEALLVREDRDPVASAGVPATDRMRAFVDRQAKAVAEAGASA
jgi:hypothetical protein